MTTPIARDIGTIPTASLEARNVDWQYFVRIDIAAPVGTKRFTQARKGDITVSIDGGSAVWTEIDLKVPRIDQGFNGKNSVSQIDFPNLDDTFGNWANSPGLYNADVMIWRGEFVLGTTTLSGSVKVFDGRIDNHQILARATLALKPGRAKWARRVMTHIPGMSPLLPAALMPKDGDIIYAGTTQARS